MVCAEFEKTLENYITIIVCGVGVNNKSLYVIRGPMHIDLCPLHVYVLGKYNNKFTFCSG